jgi:alpha-glucuronidase
LDTLDEDGFLIKTAGSKLLIAGGKEKGTLYGVYQLLENYLGCRMYSSKVQLIPENPSIWITGIDDIQEPAFAYRELHFPDPPVKRHL